MEQQARTALITGANKGLGFETALQLGAMGFTVLIGARNRTKGIEAAARLSGQGINARYIPLDVTEAESIGQAAREMEEQFGKLDVLVNNAGILLDNARPTDLDPQLLKQTFETNVFGLFAVTAAMLPLIRKSAAGRIVNMSSGLGSLTLGSDPDYQFAAMRMLAYNSSKTAVNALTVQLAYDLKETTIKINSADPGYVATDMTGHQGPRTAAQGAAVVVRLATLPEDGPTGRFFDENERLPW